MITTDVQGVDHTIEITVNDRHNMDSACPEDTFPCLADGALAVKLDGQESLASPGEVNLGPGVAISAVNLPSVCRSFWVREVSAFEEKSVNLDGVRQIFTRTYCVLTLALHVGRAISPERSS